MNDLSFDIVGLEDALSTAKKRVIAAKIALQEAESELEETELRLKLAKKFAKIVRAADEQTLAIVAQYAKAQQQRLLNTFGSNPQEWPYIDLSAFQPESIETWLAGKTIINIVQLQAWFTDYKVAAGNTLASELRGSDGLSLFACLLARSMHADDEWPPLIANAEEMSREGISIIFDKPALR